MEATVPYGLTTIWPASRKTIPLSPSTCVIILTRINPVGRFLPAQACPTPAPATTSSGCWDSGSAWSCSAADCLAPHAEDEPTPNDDRHGGCQPRGRFITRRPAPVDLRSWRSVESGKSWRDIAAPRAHPITPPTVRNDGGSDGHAPVIVTKLIVSVTNSGSVNEGAATAPGRQHFNETGRPVMKWGREATGPGCHVGDGRGATSRNT
jgi:hypothetical protein